MLRVIKPEEQDSFDELIAASSAPEFMQTVKWGRFKSGNWRPLHYLFEHEKPLVAISLWLRKIPALPYYMAYAPRGPVLLNVVTADVLADFWADLKRELSSLGAFVLKIDPAWTAAGAKGELESVGFRFVESDHPFGGVQPKATIRLDISADPEELLAQIPKKIRYNIRYPEKNGVVYRRGGKADIPMLMEVLTDTGRRKRFLGRNAAYYEGLLDTLGDRASLIVGCKDGQVLAAGVTIVCGRQAWAVYGGMLKEYASLRAYYGLNWQRMLWAKELGATSFDFSGVPVDRNEGAPLYGLYQFKKSFGGQLVEFAGEAELPVRPFLFWAWQNFAGHLLDFGRRFALRRRHGADADADEK